jgi:hypothetical protein
MCIQIALLACQLAQSKGELIWMGFSLGDGMT